MHARTLPQAFRVSRRSIWRRAVDDALARWAAWRRDRRELKEMQALWRLDERTLRDIGWPHDMHRTPCDGGR